MKKIILLPCFLMIFLFAMPVFAQTGAAQEDIKHLIGTLQDDAARKDLIANLQLLLDAQEKLGEKSEQEAPVDSLPVLTEQLGIKGTISSLTHEYQSFLDKHALSSSLIHQSVGSSVVLLFSLILLLMVRKIAARLIGAIDRFSNHLGVRLSRVSFYTRALQNIFKIIILGVTLYTLSKIWKFSFVENFFESAVMRSFISTFVTVLFVAMFAAFIWESVGVYLAYVLKRADTNNQTRVKTLLPIFRNIVFAVFGLLFGLVLLSELGINVAPFIAGAGVVGVAIGFGAQSMVKDFLTGFTIVLEDIIRVGDVVTLGNCNGVVEKITLRKVQLRDLSGIVYTIPFSQIDTIQNLTKDYSFYVMDISVSYSQDIDKVIDVLKSADADLRADKNFSDLILSPIEIFGVDRFADSSVMIKARIKTLPSKQWDVGREFNRRMKIAFDKNGIEIPFPQRVVTMINQK